MTEWLFDDIPAPTNWKEEWQDMPEFVQNEIKCYQEIIVRFDCEQDVEDFAKLIEQNLTCNTKYIYFPKQKKVAAANKRYVQEEQERRNDNESADADIINADQDDNSQDSQSAGALRYF